jgi:hypothetical protein
MSWLESTWPHVPEKEGVRLQAQEEIYNAIDNYLHRHGHELVLRLVEQRRIVKGTFHPGRKILPPSAISYELVYECVLPKNHQPESEDDLWERVRYSLTGNVVANVQRGNHTSKEEV